MINETWKVKLLNGDTFIGKKGIKEYWNQGISCRHYKVIESNELPVGIEICVPQNSKLYAYKVNDAK